MTSRWRGCPVLCRALLTSLWLSLSFTAGASSDAKAGELDQQPSLRTYNAVLQNPRDVSLFPDNSTSNQQVLLRESLKYQTDKGTRFEFNAYGLVIGSSDKSSLVQTLLNVTDESNRSPYLQRHWHDSAAVDGYLTIDRLNVRTSVGRFDLTAGRFPVNMSTMLIFTPNDFFAPFRPFDYYREYKPGVDAVRIEHALGQKGQVSVLGVAGYDIQHISSRVGPQPVTAAHYSPVQASAVARVAYPVGRFETALLGGKLGPNNIGGLTLQGEAGPVGLRAEGHHGRNRFTGKSFDEFAGGFDCRLSRRLIVAVEQFYNGVGYGSANDYAQIGSYGSSSQILISRNYTGAEANLELSGLTSLKMLVITNETDRSLLGSLDLAYAVAPNAQLVLSFLSPHGHGPDQLLPKSEFGTYPGMFSVQSAFYF